MAPAAEMSDQEQMRVALDLLDQIRQATEDLRKIIDPDPAGDQEDKDEEHDAAALLAEEPHDQD
jgi:hypothetical protein